MTEIKIEKNIPIAPKRAPGRPSKSKYPFNEMEIGDSFFVSGITLSTINCTVRKFRMRNARNDGLKFTVRAVDGGFRVWRVA